MTKLIELTGVSVFNGSYCNLQKINLSISIGEKIALIGKSGAGKSTLISVINGFTTPHIGIAKLRGENINSLKPRQRNCIATLWQDLRLIDELSVAQNINTGLLGKKNLIWALRNLLGRIESNSVRSCLKAVSLPISKIDSNIKDLSGGELQRVAIARLLRQEADILLADEPLSGLDPNLAIKILDLLSRKDCQNFCYVPETVLVSLHRPDLITNFTRVIALKDGRIVLDQPTETLNKKELEMIYL